MRKFCGKGIFREIWKNRYVVLKGDQLYISEKEVGSVSFSFPIPPSFLLFAYEKRPPSSPSLSPVPPSPRHRQPGSRRFFRGLLFSPSRHRRNPAWAGAAAPTAALPDSSGWETFSQHWTHERIHLARVKTLILLSAAVKRQRQLPSVPVLWH